MMTIPLVVLAFFSATAGFIGIPGANFFERLVHFEAAPHHGFNPLVMSLSVIAALLGIFVGYNLYIANPIRSPDEEPLRAKLGGLYDLLANKWRIDWYDPMPGQLGYFVSRAVIWFAIMWRWFDLHVIDGIVNAIGYATAFIFATAYRWFDLYIVDGAVNFIGWFTKLIGNITRRIQTGLVQHYMFLVVAGLAVIALWAILQQLR
jgi:NADH-quinone oxidoreductase subunit L